MYELATYAMVIIERSKDIYVLGVVMAASNRNKNKRLGYWVGEKPCWEMLNCPESIRNSCPVYCNPDMPGWLVGGLYCRLFDSRGGAGSFVDVCRRCRVYLRCGNGSLN
jgi:hypothetical protein